MSFVSGLLKKLFRSSFTGSLIKALNLSIPKGKRLLELPDGSKIKLDVNGNFTIDDKNAKVIYQGNRHREFNKYINASDLLENFVGFLGSLGAKQDQVLGIPINMFIHWLILKAAEKDGDQPPKEIPKIEHHPALKKISDKPRCSNCAHIASTSARRMQ